MRVIRTAVVALTLLFAVMTFPRRSIASEEADIPEVAVEKDEPMQNPYFYIKKNSKRCFMVTVGRTKGKSSFHVHYQLQSEDENDPNSSVMVEVAPQSKKISNKKDSTMTKTFLVGKGSFEFKTKSAGLFSVCTETSYDQGKGLKLFLELNMGPGDDMYDTIKKKFNLKGVQVEMVRLKRNAQDMLFKADYISDEEIGYHMQLLKLNREVSLWPVVQVIILIVTSYYQVRHLKQFFKAKRLV